MLLEAEVVVKGKHKFKIDADAGGVDSEGLMQMQVLPVAVEEDRLLDNWWLDVDGDWYFLLSRFLLLCFMD